MKQESKGMTPEEKAIALSYILSQLLKENLDIAVHEMRIRKHPEAGRLADKFDKLRGASNNAFRILERNIGNDLGNLRSDINELLEQQWG